VGITSPGAKQCIAKPSDCPCVQHTATFSFFDWHRSAWLRRSTWRGRRVPATRRPGAGTTPRIRTCASGRRSCRSGAPRRYRLPSRLASCGSPQWCSPAPAAEIPAGRAPSRKPVTAIRRKNRQHGRDEDPSRRFVGRIVSTDSGDDARGAGQETTAMSNECSPATHRPRRLPHVVRYSLKSKK
jgi:hypothetical protein